MLICKHTDTARAIARETGWDLDASAADHEWSGVGVGPVGQHRDSDALERSNFDAIVRDLRGKFGDAVDTADFGHWAVGWVEEIIWDAGREDVADAVQEWRDALEDYPVADEEDYSRLEYEEFCDYLTDCLPAYPTVDGVEYEQADREDWTSEAFSVAFDRLSYSRVDDVCEANLIRELIDAGLYVPESLEA